MRPPRTRDVREMTLFELATIVWNSDNPIARMVCLDEMETRRVSSRP